MLLDIIDNLPRLRLSSSQFKIILWLLKECKVKGVPSYNSFRKMQEELRKICGSEPRPYVSSAGNRFFVNDVRESVARDFSNPEVAQHLNFYPEITTGPISEVWQAGRWREFNATELTPMFTRGYRHFYINEVAELDTGIKVMPTALIKRDGVLCADYREVFPNPNGWAFGTETKHIAVSHFAYTYHDVIQRIGDDIKWSATASPPPMPNPLRELAGDDPLYVVMLPLWADDVSGNKSKQYNKHLNMYMVNSNIPGQLLQQEYFVRFVSTSPTASSPEQFSAIKEQILETHINPIHCFDAASQTPCRVILRVPDLPADNPQQSEEASHMGGNANMKCRQCMVGGNHEHVESDEGYHALHLVGIARTAAKTKQTLLEQLDLAMYGVKAPIERLQTATGVKDKVAQYWIDILLKRANEMKSEQPGKSNEEVADAMRAWFAEQPGDKVNPLLDISGLDPNRDTPVEILHTILLGIVKYAWHALHTSWSAKEQDLFAVRLQSTDIDGLTVPPIRAAYMMQYRNNLIGKHFKSLMQTMVFHVHGMTSPEEFILVKAISVFGAVLWGPEIDEMEQHKDDLKILIANVLDAFGDHDPARILQKVKIHLLTHLVDDVGRFGPPIRNSTEVFEGFNAVFRLCSVLSNHQAPSRDIALKFASMDRVKHIISGGYWKQGNGWIRAGEKVTEVLRTTPVLQRHLGWVPPKKGQKGTTRLPSKDKISYVPWAETQAASAAVSHIAGLDPSTHKWCRAISVIAESEDTCKQGSWVCARSSNDVRYGRILALLSCESGKFQLVVLEHFVVSERLHPDFGMPVLSRPAVGADPRLLIFLVSDIWFRFSAQHDCRLANCQPTGSRAVIQEREITSQTISLLAHTDDDHFIVNMAALHNSTLLRRALPRALTVPRPLYTDRKAHHFEVAAQKRRNTLAKKAAEGSGNNDSAMMDIDQMNRVGGTQLPEQGPRNNVVQADSVQMMNIDTNFTSVGGTGVPTGSENGARAVERSSRKRKRPNES
ncbi:hypothetical protein GGX14DRAFT_537656 [Mycena pura]|uniref:Uncharacterized protein n=1 Tax=Mycena pura TaxID=153505 RepID=A0AAD6UTA3_9AGAR|nr:hypothetical protein GGX14DRAFT_537656 [Mycena pura]